MSLRDLAVRRGVPLWLAVRRLPGLGGVLPHFVVLGAQKSGTTTLYNWLAAHRDVRRCLGQEIHYLDRHFGEGLAWYRAHFAHPWLLGRRRLTGESTPYYLFHPLAPERAAAALPETRFIAVLRDPVARTVSGYHHERAKGREPLDMLAAFEAEATRLAPETERLQREPAYVSTIHQRHGYVARSRYAEQLARWFAAVGRDRVLVLKSEDLWAGDARVAAELSRFLDLDPAGFGPPPRRNAGAYEAAPPEALAWLDHALAGPNRDLVDLLGPTFRWERP